MDAEMKREFERLEAEARAEGKTGDAVVRSVESALAVFGGLNAYRRWRTARALEREG